MIVGADLNGPVRDDPGAACRGVRDSFRRGSLLRSGCGSHENGHIAAPREGIHLAILDDTERDDTELDAVRAALNKTRRPQLAGYYGSMAGYDMHGSARLDLVGRQGKHGDVSRISGGTKIDLWLGGDRFDPASFTIPDPDGL